MSNSSEVAEGLALKPESYPSPRLSLEMTCVRNVRETLMRVLSRKRSSESPHCSERSDPARSTRFCQKRGGIGKLNQEYSRHNKTITMLPLLPGVVRLLQGDSFSKIPTAILRQINPSLAHELPPSNPTPLVPPPIHLSQQIAHGIY